MMAPIVPYLSEEMYTNLTGKESVHLADYPKYDETKIEELLEEKMDLVRELISIGRNIREEQKLRVRQPLSEILIDGKNSMVIGELTELIKEELNVKKVTYVKDTSEYMNFTVKPNFRTVGKVFGSNLKEFQDKLLELPLSDIKKLQNNESIKMTVAGTEHDIYSDMVDIRINAKDGFDVGMENNNFVILNDTLTDDLINEGIAREIISKVQTMRKNNNYELTDRITVTYNASDKVKNAIEEFSDYIKKETLATKIEFSENANEEFFIDNERVLIAISKN